MRVSNILLSGIKYFDSIEYGTKRKSLRYGQFFGLTALGLSLSACVDGKSIQEFLKDQRTSLLDANKKIFDKSDKKVSDEKVSEKKISAEKQEDQYQEYKGDSERNLLEGGSDTDRIYGYGGDDSLYGKKGADILDGGSGDDVLDGGDGADKLYGKDGNDVLYGRDGDDSLYGGDDDDFLDGGNGIDLLEGSDGDDALYGGDGNDALYGGQDSDGDDFLDGGDGDDALYGGEGDDVYQFSDDSKEHDVIFDSNGLDTIRIVSSQGKNIDPSQVTFQLKGDSLVIGYGERGSTITVKHWVNKENRIEHRIEKLILKGDKEQVYDLTKFSFTKEITRLSELTPDGDKGDKGDGDKGDKGDADKGGENLRGGTGDDVYTFKVNLKKDVGPDTIYDSGGDDTVVIYAPFHSNINPSKVKLILDGDNLRIDYGLKHTITIKDWVNVKNRIETLILKGGKEQIYDLTKFSFTKGTTLLSELTPDGDDKDADKGGENLRGGTGDDVYTFKVDLGEDVRPDTIYDSGGNDTVVIHVPFYRDFDPSSVKLILDGDDFRIDYGRIGHTVTIKDWVNVENRVETLTFVSKGGKEQVHYDLTKFSFTKGTTLLSELTADSDGGHGGGDDGDEDSEYYMDIDGSDGDDTYTFKLNYRKDSLPVEIFDPLGDDEIVLEYPFGGNLDPSKVKLFWDGEDLKIDYGLKHTITIRDWVNVDNRVETLILKGGKEQVYDLASFSFTKEMTRLDELTPEPLAEDEFSVGSPAFDTIDF